MVKKSASKKSRKTPKELDKTPVTSETVEDHRRDILKKAKKFVRPVGVSRRKFIILSVSIVAAVLVVFLGVVAALIYRGQSDSSIVYGVSQVVPYPAAKVNGSFVSYGDYLFELNPLKHYYENQEIQANNGGQSIDFSSEEGKQQLADLENIAFASAKKKAIVKQLAAENDVTVTDEELNEAVDAAISREGGENKFKEAIQFFYGWDLDDFRRVMYAQLLQQKLQPVYSEEQRQQAEDILVRIQNGEDFAGLAKEFSEDTASKDKGGDLGLSARGAYVAEFEDAAFALDVGQVSGVVETQYGFHIIKVTGKQDDKIQVSHILIQYADVDQIVSQKLAEASVSDYISLPVPSSTEQPSQ